MVKRFATLITVTLVLAVLVTSYSYIYPSPVNALTSGSMDSLTVGGKVYKLVWSEEFDEPTINESVWSFEVSDGCPNLCGWGNNELEYYTKDNAWIENGYLVIEARKLDKPITGPTGVQHYYTSARLKTQGKFEIKYGLIVFRAKLPEGKGIWPALWLLGSNINRVGWPKCGEIDVMELLGHQPDVVYGTAHSANCFGGRGVGSLFRLPKGEKFSDYFHEFAIEWTPYYIKWYVDWQLYHVINRDEYVYRGCDWPFDQPFFIIVNVAVGGNWPGYPDESTRFPQRMYIDCIRVYELLFDPSQDPFAKTWDSDNEVFTRSWGDVWPSITREAIVNGDFSKPIDLSNNPGKNPDDWMLFTIHPKYINMSGTDVESNRLRISLTGDASSAQPQDIQLGQFVWLRQGADYSIRFYAWASREATIKLVVVLTSRSLVPIKTYLEVPINLGTKPRLYEVIYSHGEYSANIVYIGFYLGGNGPVDIYLSNVALEPVTRGGRPYTVTRTETETETQTLTSTVTKTTTVTEVIREATTFLSTKTVTATTEIVKGMPEAQVYTIGAGLLAIGAILGYLLARKRR